MDKQRKQGLTRLTDRPVARSTGTRYMPIASSLMTKARSRRRAWAIRFRSIAMKMGGNLPEPEVRFDHRRALDGRYRRLPRARNGLVPVL
jgi:hypothetical protein